MEPFKKCRVCGSTKFWTGPRGGAALNVMCIGCRQCYNLLVHPGAPIMLIEEISNNVEWLPGDVLDTEDGSLSHVPSDD